MARLAVADSIAAADMVARARSGDVAAFEQLLEPRLDGLRRTALSILRDDEDARDATQEAALAAWRELPRLRGLDRFDAWLGRILLNSCRMALRRRRRRPVVQELTVQTEGDDAHRVMTPGLSERAAAVDAIRRALANLGPDERIVLALRYSEDRQIEDIASLLGIPEGTVKWRLHEARRALERYLEVEFK